MIHVVVGSTNPVKVDAAHTVFQHAFSGVVVQGRKTASGVPDQPWGHDETRTGAFTRAQAALVEGDYGVGIESGLVNISHGLMTINWCVILSHDGVEGLSSGFGYMLPRPVAELIEQGYALGQAIDRVTGQNDIRSGPGASGILTDHLITRQQGYEQLVMLALAPFRRPDLYSKGS